MKNYFMTGGLLLASAGLVACGDNAGDEEAGGNGTNNNENVENVEEDGSDFPSRQVRYIVPYGPGGLSDITARVNEAIIRNNDMLDEDFTVTNIEGASAGNGMNEVLNADPDGHTLLHHHTSFMAHTLSGVRDWGYEEYTPVAQLFEVPHVIFTHPDHYETMEEFLDDVDSNPGENTVGTSSPGGLTYINMLAMLHQLDIEEDVTYVAHGGGGDLNSAMLGGENSVGVGQLPQHIEYHRSGDLNILAVASDERMDAIPEVPTFDEVGLDIDDYVIQTMGVWAPPETSQGIVDELETLFSDIVAHDDYLEEADEQGFTPNFGDGETLIETFEEDEDQLVEFLESSGVDLE